MASHSARSLDLVLGLTLSALGVLFIAIAARGSSAAFHFVPALDGCLTMGVVGFGLCLIEGYGYATSLLTMAPVVAIQSMGTQQHHASWFAFVGMEAIVFGFVGLLFALRASRRAEKSAQRPASRTSAAPLAEAAST